MLRNAGSFPVDGSLGLASVRTGGALMNYPYLIPGQQANTTSFVANATLKLGAYSQAIDAITTISVDYSQLIPAMSLTRFSFKIQPGGSPQLWIDTVKISGDILTFMLSGGMGGRSYELAITSHATDGEARTDVLNVNVIGDDICCDSPQPLSLTGDGGVVYQRRLTGHHQHRAPVFRQWRSPSWSKRA